MFAHIDADAFFASVLQRKNPRLKGKPLLALGMGGGIAIAASYEAKRCGVRTGMRLQEARKLAPNAVAVPSDFLESCVASSQIESVLKNECPLIEKMSIDEWFLDLTSCAGGMPKNLKIWATAVQEKVRRSVGLTVSVGIAQTKLLAKMASEYRKPAGVTIVNEDGIDIGLQDFLCDRPAAAIPGIGSRRQVHADAHNWKTAWDIANAPADEILRIFGRPGLDMQSELLGHPVEDIRSPAPPKSVSRCRSFRATRDQSTITGFLFQHFSHCILKMRRQELMCKCLNVWLRDSSFRYMGEVRKFPEYLDTEEQILPYLRACFERIHEPHKSYTQVGMALLQLHAKGPKQYDLFEAPENTNRSESMQESLDTIRTRYGRGIIVRATGMNTAEQKKQSVPSSYGDIPSVT